MPTVNPVQFVYDSGDVAYEDFRLYFNTDGIEEAERFITETVEEAGCADERVYGYVTFRQLSDGSHTYSVHFDSTIEGIQLKDLDDGDSDSDE